MYLKTKDLSKYHVLDIETDSLEATKIRCMVVKNCATRRIWRCTDVGSIKRFFSEVSKDALFVVHNGLSFDFPVLYHLIGVEIPIRRIVDTLCLSYLYHPYLEGGHSLDSWGTRVGLKKVIVPDFSDVSDELLLARCEQDVEITHRAWIYLCDVMNRIGYSEQSCEIEHRIRVIVDQQQRNGFYFNTAGAESLYKSLRVRQQSFEGAIKDLFPKRLRPVKSYEYRLKQDGEPYSSYLRHIGQYPRIDFNEEGSNYTVYDWEEFNLGSPTQRVSRLLELGWQPQKFTKPSKTHPQGQPQVDEDSLLEASERLGKPELKALGTWVVTSSRAGMVRTWLNAVDRETSLVHGTVFSCGALSRRMRHVNPNGANIPSNEAMYGLECRALWEAGPGRVLLGEDAKGIQMRIMGHYTDLANTHPEIYKLYLGKPHQRNADLIGNGCTYKQAKNDFFAFIFGCYDLKLGRMHGIGNKEDAIEYGAYIRSKLYESCPGLKEATDDCQEEWKQNKGRLRCLDGGYVVCPAKHAAFNYWVQPGEAVVRKQAMIYLHQKIRKEGLDVQLCATVHDETQRSCSDRATAERAGALAKESMVEAGETFNLRTSMDANFAVGKDWSETHT